MNEEPASTGEPLAEPLPDILLVDSADDFSSSESEPSSSWESYLSRDEMAKNVDAVEAIYSNQAIINAIVDTFKTEAQKKLSVFIRKRISIKFNSLSSCLFDEIHHDYAKLLLLSFSISPYKKYGLISFDILLLNTVINLLYGGGESEEEASFRSPGKIGPKISLKLVGIFLCSLQKSLVENLKIQLQLEDASSQLSLAFKNGKTDKGYNFYFTVFFDNYSTHLNFVIPESLFLNSILEADSLAMQEDKSDEFASEPIIDEKTKNELVNFNVDVLIKLEKITLKLREVANLKAGDLIEISDPRLVYVTFNGKSIFKAYAGQINQKKAVKILEKM